MTGDLFRIIRIMVRIHFRLDFVADANGITLHAQGRICKNEEVNYYFLTITPTIGVDGATGMTDRQGDSMVFRLLLDMVKRGCK